MPPKDKIVYTLKVFLMLKLKNKIELQLYMFFMFENQ